MGRRFKVLKLLDRAQGRALALINDNSVSHSIDSLEHRRNVGCISLFYRYYHGKCSSEISELVPSARVFVRSTRLSSRSHPFVVSWPVDRTTHYRENSFFSRTVRMWTKLPSTVFPATYNLKQFKTNIHRHYSLFPPSSTLSSSRQHNALHL